MQSSFAAERRCYRTATPPLDRRGGFPLAPTRVEDSASAPTLPPQAAEEALRQCASGLGRSWKFTTSGLDAVSGDAPGAPGAGASMPSM
jgi:hypothetical protein